jgi:adenylate cyclase
VPSLKSPSRQSQAVPSPLVLVVDDEPDILACVRDLVESRLGYATLLAESGPTALALLANLRPRDVDLVVSDYRMAPMDGVEFLHRARRLHRDLPAILCTAYPELPVAIAAVNKARVDRFLTKPFEPEAFVQAVEELVSRHRAGHSRQAALLRAVRFAPRRFAARRQ